MTAIYPDIQGKNAVVTGASQGIGRNIAMGFCRMGANVALLDLRRETLERTVDELTEEFPDVKIIGVSCDISNPDSVNEAAAEIVRELSGIDVLVNNAGILIRSSLERMKIEDWNRVLEVNLSGVLHCSRSVLSSMKERGGGRIINVSSNVAAMPSVGMGAYCITKAAVETLTRVMAAEFAPYGILVNAYAPGVVVTEMTRDILESRAEEKLKGIPIRRFANPEDITSLVLFLASEASSYINGTILSVDGGMLATHNPWKAWS